jgi:hypothetical protein
VSPSVFGASSFLPVASGAYLNRYLCTVYNYNYTFGGDEALLGSHYVPAVRVARIAVLARNGREAAARGYVRTVGRVRARFLQSLNAPEICVLIESRWRRMAGAMRRTTNWLGDCFVFDNRVEAFYVQIERLSSTAGSGARRQTRRGRLLRALRSSSLN